MQSTLERAEKSNDFFSDYSACHACACVPENPFYRGISGMQDGALGRVGKMRGKSQAKPRLRPRFPAKVLDGPPACREYARAVNANASPSLARGGVLTLALLVLLLFTSAVTAAHDWFTGATSPTGGRKCCNDLDCRPVPVRLNQKTGELEVELQHQWWPATDPRWYLGSSPDGSWLGCWWGSDKQPRCVWGGQGS